MASTTSTFTVGNDCSAVLVDPYGNNITLPLLTQIDTTPEYSTAKAQPIGKPPIERYLPAGHKLKFSFDRADGNVDKLFSQIEAGWWAAGTSDGGTNSTGGVYIYVTETGGGQTTYQYGAVSFQLTNSGSISPDNPVKQEISAFAQTRTVS
ncbi:MAG TPA: hypothetical protein VMH92_05905 [Acidocella sp.]|nr:hypothetical protein [Acidocella sp.]